MGVGGRERFGQLCCGLDKGGHVVFGVRNGGQGIPTFFICPCWGPCAVD